ncbi:hypothetical protein [Glutamicibacter sp. TV12E]|uniref:hypothetical protein n=1 Tax=Glutamicibacter sp. TV12E TaxID=3446362 RepID=UPI0040338F24
MYPDQPIDPNYLKGLITNVTRLKNLFKPNIDGKTLADYALDSGDAKGGAVIYNRVTGQHEPLDGRSVEEVAYGASFPILDFGEGADLLEKVKQRGAAIEMTDAAIRRNETNTFKEKTAYLEAACRRKNTQVALNAIVNDPDINEFSPTTPWAAGDDKIGDIYTGVSLINDTFEELGYVANSVLINPLDALEHFLRDKSIREQFPRESKELNPVLSGDMDGIAGLSWIKNSKVKRGEMYIFQSKIIGSLRDEMGGLQVKSYAVDERNVQRVQAWYENVPVITNPKAITKLVFA